MANERIWTKEYVLLMAANFFVSINFYALLSTSASFALSKLDSSDGQAGFATGVFIVGALLARAASGRYAYRIGFKRTLLFGIGALIACSALYCMIQGFAVFCLIRFASGMTFGVNSNTITTAVTHIIPRKKSGEGMAWYAMSQVAGMAIGPFIAVSLMARSGFEGIFLFSTLAAAAAFVVMPAVKLPQGIELGGLAETPETSGNQIAPERGLWRFIERSVLPIGALCFVFYVSYACYISFVAIFAAETGAANVASYLFLASAGAILVSRPIAGKLFDRNGPRQLMVCAFVIFAAGFLLLGRGAPPMLLLSAAAIMGLGIGTLQGTTMSLVVTTAPRHRLGVANATYFISVDLGVAAGPVIGGSIAGAYGYGAMYAVCAVIGIAGLPLYLAVIEKRLKTVNAK